VATCGAEVRTKQWVLEQYHSTILNIEYAMKTPATVLLSACCLLCCVSRLAFSQAVNPETRLGELNIELPEVSAPVGIYRRAVIVGNLIYLAGHISVDENGQVMAGKVGRDVDIDEAQRAARRSGLALLATLRAELGSLNRVKRLIKTTGMVNCTDDYIQQPAVINGCSQLFVDMFGKEHGIGARCAVGVSSLPKGAIVEIEAVFELQD
jgi:enamine deaminase RidA (YjgF/YER057c/UK114 family)